MEHLAEGLAQGGKVEADKSRGDDGVHTSVHIGDIDTGQLTDDAQRPGQQDAVQDSALDVLDEHDGNQQHADQGQQGADADAVEGLALEVLVGQQRGVAVDDELGVLQADEGDEQADADADRRFQGQGDGVEDGLAHIGQGQHDEHDALNKDGQQGHLPGVAHRQHDGVGKVGVQAHAGGQRKRIVGQECHEHRAEEGCQ